MTIKEAIVGCSSKYTTEAQVIRAVSAMLRCKPQSVKNVMIRLRMDGFPGHLERGKIHHKGRSQEGHGWRFGD